MLEPTNFLLAENDVIKIVARNLRHDWWIELRSKPNDAILIISDGWDNSREQKSVISDTLARMLIRVEYTGYVLVPAQKPFVDLIKLGEKRLLEKISGGVE